jgi:hypothetical protein
MDKFKLVKIEWVDSFGCGSRWELLDDIQDVKHVNHSVGWLVGDGVNVKVLVPHIQPENEDIDAALMGCGDMAIPVEAIVNLVELVEDKND